MANSVDPDQTAPIGAVCSGSKLFASILNLSVMLGNYLQQTTSADDIFRCIFFLGALMDNILCFLLHFWSLFQVQSYLPLSIINYGISKHYAGYQVSNCWPLGYLFGYVAFYVSWSSGNKQQGFYGWPKVLIIRHLELPFSEKKSWKL